MYKPVLIAFSCILILQDLCVSAQSRDEIVKRYQPRLQEQATQYLTTYQANVNQSALIIQDIKNNTLAAIGIVEAQIANCRTGIDLAKKQAAAKPKALQCITAQETLSTSLSSASINQTCAMPNFTSLNNINKAYEILANVATLTINACDRLNPLALQLESFVRCITDKIIDLDQEYFDTERDYDKSRSDVINEHIQCLTTATNPIVQKVNGINFQVTLCLSLG